MNEKIRDKINESKEELKRAKRFFGNGEYSEFIFYSQQVIEKSLKALYMFRIREIARGDSIGLAQRMKIENELMLEIKELSPEYLFMKYPDVKMGIPKEFAEMHTNTAEKVLNLVLKEIKFEDNENVEMENEIKIEVMENE